ncbi:hypothetical protein PTKIN_Ptkin14bG0137400 [Pterospermum kingtungense]
MVGCRDLRSENKASLNHSMDCEILVSVQFPPLNSDRKQSKIKGSIKSMREKTDQLYLETMDFSGRAYYGSWAMESIWRIDLQTIMSVISNTLAIVFVVLQIFHERSTLMWNVAGNEQGNHHVVTMVAFMLQLCLLMLSWTSRCFDGKKKALWVAEMRGLYVCFPLYIAGGVIAFFVKWKKNLDGNGRYPSYHREQIILGVQELMLV